MAVQSSFYLVDGSTRTFPSTKHIATKQHCAIYLKDKVSLLWSVASVETYTLINNSIVFDIAPASATYSDIEVRVADTQDELVDLPSDIAIVASNIADVQSLAANIDDINSIGDNLDALLVIPANLSSITSVASDVTNINLVANNITAVDIVSNHVENIDSVSATIVPNIVEILLADDNASIATAQAVIATEMANTVTSIYDQFDDRYLGSKAVAPTLDNDGNALLIGALYFDTTTNLMKVYGSSGWVSAGSSVNGTTERHTYTATAGQTSFNANYESGYVDVYLNGSKLQTGVDFTATSGTAIVLTSSANVGDIVDVIAYGVFEVANTTPKGNEAYTVSTVDDLVSVPSSYTTAIVKDLDRGGTFIWSSTGTANGGTVFAGATGYWTRQYSGAVNVKWFGAKGDWNGTTGTDDTLAILNAIGNYALISSIFIPKGNYLVTSKINTGVYKKIQGCSESLVKITFNSTDDALFECDAFTEISNVKLINITPTGNKIAVSSYTPTTSNGMRNSIMKNVTIEDFYYGLGSSQGLAQSLVFSNVYENVKIYNANVAVYFGAGANENLFIKCEFWNCNRALGFNNATSQKFISCGFEGSVQYDFYIDTTFDVSFDSCYFEPAIGGISLNSSLYVDNCHSTNFATSTTKFIDHQLNSKISINNFTDYNLGNESLDTQYYTFSSDATGRININQTSVRTGTEKTYSNINNVVADGRIRACYLSGDYLVTKYESGLMTIDLNTDISTNTLIMTGTTTEYHGTITLPESFLSSGFIATSSIFFNGSSNFLLIDSPTITCRPVGVNTVDLKANRTTTVAADGYYIAMRCVGLWK